MKKVAFEGFLCCGWEHFRAWWIATVSYLVGGFRHFLFFHNVWDNPSHWLSYFSRWLKPPTSYSCCCKPSLFVVGVLLECLPSWHRRFKPKLGRFRKPLRFERDGMGYPQIAILLIGKYRKMSYLGVSHIWPMIVAIHSIPHVFCYYVQKTTKKWAWVNAGRWPWSYMTMLKWCVTNTETYCTHTHPLKLDNSMPRIATTSGFCGEDQYPDLPCGSTSGLRIWDDWIPGLVFLKGSPTSQWSILISSVEIVILWFFRYSDIPNI
jgi:hypothetical protein